MANPLKKLASETAIYGLSTILARIINFFFVPVYTRILSQGGYGSYAEIMSYIAVFQVILVLGLETGCFKFAADSSNPDKVFSTALSTVTALSLLFFGLVWMFSPQISSSMGYEGMYKMIIYVGGILALDSFTAILFARLRQQQKALKFALFKSIKIMSELGFNLLLFFVVPTYFASHPNSLLSHFIPAQIHFSYIIFAVFLSCIVCFILFIPDLFKVRFGFDKSLWKSMMLYSLPLMIANLPGIVNESADRFLFRFLVGDGYTGSGWAADLGVYQAAVKLAVIMNLFIQMFKYAAEPFFFARYKEKGSNELYARVMEYFVIFCMLIFLGMVFYVDIIGLILGSDFRMALGTMPVILLSYIILGMLYNVSMWYKLSGHTKFAIVITLLGLSITIAGNFIFMPKFSYKASAWVHLISCLIMLIYSTYLGAKYYPIPYNWRKISAYIFSAISLFLISELVIYLLDCNLTIKLVINTLLIVFYLVYIERKTHLITSFVKK